VENREEGNRAGVSRDFWDGWGSQKKKNRRSEKKNRSKKGEKALSEPPQSGGNDPRRSRKAKVGMEEEKPDATLPVSKKKKKMGGESCVKSGFHYLKKAGAIKRQKGKRPPPLPRDFRLKKVEYKG